MGRGPTVIATEETPSLLSLGNIPSETAQICDYDFCNNVEMAVIRISVAKHTG